MNALQYLNFSDLADTDGFKEILGKLKISYLTCGLNEDRVGLDGITDSEHLGSTFGLNKVFTIAVSVTGMSLDFVSKT